MGVGSCFHPFWGLTIYNDEAETPGRKVELGFLRQTDPMEEKSHCYGLMEVSFTVSFWVSFGPSFRASFTVSFRVSFGFHVRVHSGVH